MNELSLSAPWETYQRKLKAFFADTDIEVCSPVRDDTTGEVCINVLCSNVEKYTALACFLKPKVTFGNVDVNVKVTAGETVLNDAVAMYKKLFNGNLNFRDIKNVDAPGPGAGWTYVRFWPDVIQFFDDDLSDFNRNWNGLAEDIAREIFIENGVQFCTAPKEEN